MQRSFQQLTRFQVSGKACRVGDGAESTVLGDLSTRNSSAQSQEGPQRAKNCFAGDSSESFVYQGAYYELVHPKCLEPIVMSFHEQVHKAW